MNKNPDTKLVPCHRVVRSDGRAGGYASGTPEKIERLKKEGVLFDGEMIIKNPR